MNFLQPIGRATFGFMATIGRITIFIGTALMHSVRPPFYPRIIATDPKIIFFDEPTTGLDPIRADIINDLIVHCVEETGATALTITHDMISARKIADRIAMIYEGKIIWFGGTDEIDHSGSAHVDQFIHGRSDGPIQMAVHV